MRNKHHDELDPELPVVGSLGPVYANSAKRILTTDDKLYYSKGGSWVPIAGGGGGAFSLTAGEFMSSGLVLVTVFALARSLLLVVIL